MSKLDRIKSIPAHIAKLEPYRAGLSLEELVRKHGWRAGDPVAKLASNENPFGCSPKVLEVLKDTDDLALYPEPQDYNLRLAIAQYIDAPVDCIGVGAGSEGVLYTLARALLAPGDQVVLSQNCFPVHRIAPQHANATIIEVPTHSDLSHDVDAICKVINSDTKLVSLANPDNPTGAVIPLEGLERIKQALPLEAFMIVDEAYHELCDSPSYISSLEGNSRVNDLTGRLITTRTFSKSFGIAALRVGFLVARSDIIERYYQIRQSFSVSRVSQKAAIEALKDLDFVAQSKQKLSKEKQRVVQALSDSGWSVLAGGANFFLVDCKDKGSGEQVYQNLLKYAVMTRPLGGSIKHLLRISVGTPEQNDRLLSKLE